MKHTTDALQTMGLKVAEADNIMIDLEEHTGDLNAVQNTLASSIHTDYDLTQEDLENELALMLSDDAMCAVHTVSSVDSQSTKNTLQEKSNPTKVLTEIVKQEDEIVQPVQVQAS